MTEPVPVQQFAPCGWIDPGKHIAGACGLEQDRLPHKPWGTSSDCSEECRDVHHVYQPAKPSQAVEEAREDFITRLKPMYLGTDDLARLDALIEAVRAEARA